jgi:NADPH2:quinone reductase
MTAKALLAEQHGEPETLVYRDVEIGEPGPGELRIRMEAAGLNFPDALIIRNLYQMKPPLPFSPGAELAGTVTAVGPDVDGFKPGDRVAALTNWGAFSEEVIASATQTTHVPDTMDARTAAAFTLAYGTSHHALKQRAQLKAGETLLVLGAAGGVGLSAVEIGKAMGARVIAAASTPEKLEIAREHGADVLFDYSTEDLRGGLKALGPVDVVYDPVGDRFSEPAFRTLRWGGRHLVIGFTGGTIPAIPLNLPLVKGASIVGVFWGDFVARDNALHQANMTELYEMHAEGKLKPLVSKSFPLAQGGDAIRWMMDRKALGKVIVTAG